MSFEGLEDGRDRASTSTTVTGQAATDINDNDSRTGKIDAERADSDMPLRTLDALITSSKANRRASYTDYDQPYEEYVLESEDAEYEEEMAYLLAQVRTVHIYFVLLYCEHEHSLSTWTHVFGWQHIFVCYCNVSNGDYCFVHRRCN